MRVYRLIHLLAACLTIAAAHRVSAADDLTPLSDEFDNATSLANFQRLFQSEGWPANQLQTIDVNTSQANHLVMVPHPSSWYQDYKAALAFKTITGDFVATIDVRVSNLADSGAPNANYSFGGLLVRAPRPTVTSPGTWQSGQEDWVIQAVGTAGSPGNPNFEEKSTDNSVTSPNFPGGSGQATLQIARIGNAFLLLRQPAGGSWSVVRRYTRADMPAAVQVGLTAYGNFNATTALTPLQHNQSVISGSSADLTARFDYYRLQRPVVPANLQGMNFASAAQVSDAQLLAFLADNANSEPVVTVAPGITSQPAGQTVDHGDSASFSVTATGTAPFSYQWRRDGVAIAGATESSYTIANTSTNDSGAAFSVVVTNPAGSATSANATLNVNAPPPPVGDELSGLSDEFDNPATLSNWNRVYQVEGWGVDQLEQWDINQSNAGRMTMMPHTSSWFEEWRGVQAYKQVTGDFVVTTDVEPTGRSGTGAPNTQYSLAGIMVRTPRPEMQNGRADWTPNGQNYIFLSMGAASQPGSYQFEVKNTLNSNSQLEVSNGGSRARIQIARIGSAFIVLRQIDNGAWEVHRRYTRADMPQTLNVGLTTYTDWPPCQQAGYEYHNTNLLTGAVPRLAGGTVQANPDLIARFDYVRYRRPQVPTNLNGLNFADAGQVSDAQLLAFLASNANLPAGTTNPPPVAPSIATQPLSQTVGSSDTASFAVTASGTSPLTYQWRRDGTDIHGANSAAYSLNNVTTNDSGAVFTVLIGNVAGSIVSSGATLTVTNANLPAPILQPDTATLHHQQKARINVLANDPAGIVPGSVQIVTAPQFGSATPDAQGRILYHHTNGTPPNDTFTYLANSGGTPSTPVTVTLNFATSLRIANPALRLPAQPPATAIQLVPAYPGLSFSQPIAVTSPQGDNQRLFIIERRVGVRLIPDVASPSPTSQIFFDLAGHVAANGETIGDRHDQGIMGLAFHPGYATNRHFFMCYSARVGGLDYIRLSRFTTQAGDPNAVDGGSELVFLQQRDQNGFHLGMDIQFGPDGYLYLGLGDGGGQNDSRGNGQLIDRDFFCAISRIDVDKRPGNREPNIHASVPRDNGIARYSIPADNPYVTDNATVSYNGGSLPATSVRSEFFANGLRNPWRFSFDNLTGELWTGDVGQNAREEVNVIVNGGNYGWAYREGTLNGPRVGEAPTGFTSIPPIYEYTRGNGEFQGFSISAGLVYRGTSVSSLQGAYIFADYVSGNIWSLRRNGTNANVERVAGEAGIISFGTDPATGDLLAIDYGDNRILRVISTPSSNDPFPQNLSDTGLFADLTDLSPAPGLLPYQPNLRFWSDHADKRRWFAIPDATNRMTWTREDAWTVPEGAVFVKHFDLELERGNPATSRRIETRLLVKNTTGVYGVSYRWNEAQTDATLVGDSGESFSLNVIENSVTRTQDYRIPSRAECLACHTPQAGHVLSLDTRQLNRNATINGFTGNQLTLLHEAGYLQNQPESPNLLPRHLRPDETNYPLEARVRSYLAVNCANCHRAGGTATPSWDGRASLTLEQTGLLNGTAINNGGDPVNRLIVPGDSAHSIILNRVAVANGFTRMPQIGSNELDQPAIAMLTEWINQSLPNRQSYDEWRLARFGSTSSANGEPTADPDLDRADNRTEFLTGTDPNNRSSFLTTSITTGPTSVTLGINLPANRWFQVESSTNLFDWNIWDVPGNHALPAPGLPVSLTAPTANPNQYFRIRIGEN